MIVAAFLFSSYGAVAISILDTLADLPNYSISRDKHLRSYISHP